MLDRIVESPYDALATSSAAMRHNRGNLYINPADILKTSITEENAVMMADLTYLNYAAGPDEIDLLYKKGFTKGSATVPSVSIDSAELYNMSAVLKSGPKPF